MRVDICFRSVLPSAELAQLVASACAEVDTAVQGDTRWRFDFDRDRVQCRARVKFTLDGATLESEANSSDSVVACWRALTALYDQLVKTRNPMSSLRPTFGSGPRRVLPGHSKNSQTA